MIINEIKKAKNQGNISDNKRGKKQVLNNYNNNIKRNKNNYNLRTGDKNQRKKLKKIKNSYSNPKKTK